MTDTMTGFKGRMAPSDHLLRWTLLGLALVLPGAGAAGGAGVGVGYGLYVGAAVAGAVGLRLSGGVLVVGRPARSAVQACSGGHRHRRSDAVCYDVFTGLCAGRDGSLVFAVAVLAANVWGSGCGNRLLAGLCWPCSSHFCGLRSEQSSVALNGGRPFTSFCTTQILPMLLLGFRIGWDMRARAQFWKVVSWLWVPVAVIVAADCRAEHLFSLAVE